MKKVLIASSLTPVIEKEKGILNRTDFKIFTATSGEDAINIHRAEKVDLIVADLDMPKMNGEILCSAIREDETLKKVSIIIVCSNRKSDLEKCSNIGANSYLTKPIDPAKFIDKVIRLLNVSERKAYRVLIKVEVKGKFMNVPFFCSSKDLSASGIMLETDKPLAKGDIISCSFFLPNTQRIAVDGEIVRVVRTAIKTFQYGVRFINLNPDHMTAVETFVKNWNREDL